MFAQKLLSWYNENQRTLPWRGEKDPYKIWVSEIILQQTRVQQGLDYYLQFTETFPTVHDLARADEEQVLRVWQGLGYYSRARNMHAAAQQVVERHHGTFPSSYNEIRELKGIGDYTAAAISSIAFRLPYPAVDGNVLRIISRIFGIFDDISLPKTKRIITEVCQQHIPENDPGTFNQACMDLGALCCSPRNPNCNECPLSDICYAHAHQQTDLLPVKTNKLTKKDRFFLYYIYICKNEVLLEKRTGNDIWKNLYQFPLTEVTKDEFEQVRHYDDEIREVLTHQNIHARFIVGQEAVKPSCRQHQTWVNIERLESYPTPKIITTFIEKHLTNEQ